MRNVSGEETMDGEARKGLVGLRSVATRIFLLCTGIAMAFSAGLFWMYSLASDHLWQARRASTRQTVEAASTMAAGWVAKASRGALSTQEAQKAALEQLKGARYDGSNYFWVNDLGPKMVMHPYKPELDGKELASNVDPKGKHLFVEMVQVARRLGAGFVDYDWPKPGLTAPVGKISYVKLIPEWGWIIGSGVYVDDVEAELARIRNTVVAMLLAVLGVSLLFVRATAKGMAKPMGEIAQALEELEQGHVGVQLHSARADEIGQMVRAVAAFAESLQREFIAELHKLASGDLSGRVEPRDAADVLRGSVRRLSEELANLVGGIQGVGGRISQRAQHVSTSSQALSQGAQRQAESIEQITSLVGELSTKTGQNASHATKVRVSAQATQDGAQKGARQVEQMAEAIRAMNEAGASVLKITKLVEDIAFQTNILSLNAAVEAARAGRHGKGFAVVAAEVGALASRSAKAAQETAELIQSSVANAAHGAQIADGAVASLNEIVQLASTVSGLVGQIADASRDQAQGLDQVKQALASIDHVTQGNTDGARQSAKAAADLFEEVEGLQTMLGRFQLGEEGSAAPGG
jgi:methyl-accepting chemotaxis protein